MTATMHRFNSSRCCGGDNCLCSSRRPSSASTALSALQVISGAPQPNTECGRGHPRVAPQTHCLFTSFFWTGSFLFFFLLRRSVRRFLAVATPLVTPLHSLRLRISICCRQHRRWHCKARQPPSPEAKKPPDAKSSPMIFFTHHNLRVGFGSVPVQPRKDTFE